MKKSKLLIPALSIASVGAVVAPMVTSCSSSAFLSTSDLNYRGTLHDIVETADAWDLAKANEEYYKDSKYLGEDVLATLVLYIAQTQWFSGLKQYANVNFNFNMNIDKLTVGDEKTATVIHGGTEYANTKGHLISGTISGKYTASYDEYPSTSSQYSNIHHDKEESFEYSFTNCFVSLSWSETDKLWGISLDGCKDASAEWEENTVDTKSETVTNTLRFNGSTTSSTEASNEAHVYGLKHGDADKTLIPKVQGQTVYAVSSYYLSKVAHKA